MKKLLLVSLLGFTIPFKGLSQFEPDMNNNPAFLGVSYVTTSQFEKSLINMGFKKRTINDKTDPKNTIILLENKDLGYKVITKIGGNNVFIELTNLSSIYFDAVITNLDRLVSKLVDLYDEPYRIDAKLDDVKRSSTGIILSDEKITNISYYWFVNDKIVSCLFTKDDVIGYKIAVSISRK